LGRNPNRAHADGPFREAVRPTVRIGLTQAWDRPYGLLSKPILKLFWQKSLERFIDIDGLKSLKT